MRIRGEDRTAGHQACIIADRNASIRRGAGLMACGPAVDVVIPRESTALPGGVIAATGFS